MIGMKYFKIALATTMVATLSLPGYSLPHGNPAAEYSLEWVETLPWKRVVNIQEFSGTSWTERLMLAQEALRPEGGVIFFPAGTYLFEEDIVLRERVILRGEAPGEVTRAHEEGYQLRSRIQFPPFQPSLSDEGSPHESSFHLIRLADPETAAQVGLVHLHIDYGTVDFSDGEDRKAGRDRLVYGCILTHAIRLDPQVPDASIGQHPWQRYPLRHHAAINVYSGENALVANNRLPRSTDHYRMPGYVVTHRGEEQTFDVLFDFDNRYGIKVNVYSIGGAGTRDPHGTPETHPYGFRQGTVIRDNYIYHTGRGAIGVSGDGAIVAHNVSRMKPDFIRYTHTGRHRSTGSATNGNRALMMRGWNNHIEGNDYRVYQNIAADGVYPINCGEGLMHEGHANSTIRNLTIINNTGNAYLSLYMTAGINGLHIEGNDIRTRGGISAIYVRSDRTWDRHEVKNVSILNNLTLGSGITLSGDPSENNLIQGNRHLGESPGRLILMVEKVTLQENQNYEIDRRELRLRP